MNSRSRLTAVLAGTPADSLPLMPITMMFAADQISVPYLQYATDHATLARAQLATAERFDFDYVSVISDPAREAADLGAKVFFPPNAPPALDESASLLADPASLSSLRYPDPRARGGGRMSDRVAAVKLLAQSVGNSKIIEGWVEGPIAEASDLRGINHLMLDFLDNPTFVHDLFEFTLTLAIKFAHAQIAAGATLVGVGDAAASLVGPDLYAEFVLPYEKRLIDAIHSAGARVRLHICGNTQSLFPHFASLSPDILDLDYPVLLTAARQALPNQVLLGNLDPVRAVRNSHPAAITAALAQCHAAAGPKFIVGAGCEIPRDTPPENLHALRLYARSHTP